MRYFTVSRLVVFIGVLLILLHAFGVQFGAANLFEIGVGCCFAGTVI